MLQRRAGRYALEEGPPSRLVERRGPAPAKSGQLTGPDPVIWVLTTALSPRPHGPARIPLTSWLRKGGKGSFFRDGSILFKTPPQLLAVVSRYRRKPSLCSGRCRMAASTQVQPPGSSYRCRGRCEARCLCTRGGTLNGGHRRNRIISLRTVSLIGKLMCCSLFFEFIIEAISLEYGISFRSDLKFQGVAPDRPTGTANETTNKKKGKDKDVDRGRLDRRPLLWSARVPQ